jgi:hypothetical protein
VFLVRDIEDVIVSFSRKLVRRVKQGLRIRLSALIEAPSVLANRFRRNGNDFPEADLRVLIPLCNSARSGFISSEQLTLFSKGLGPLADDGQPGS